MSEGFESSSPQKVSTFNGSIAQIMRLDALWKDCHKHSREKHYDKWNDDLDRVWCELSEDASDTDSKTFEKYADDYLEKRSKGKNVYYHLLKKEIFLRKLQNTQGLGKSYKDESEDDFD